MFAPLLAVSPVRTPVPWPPRRGWPAARAGVLLWLALLSVVAAAPTLPYAVRPATPGPAYALTAPGYAAGSVALAWTPAALELTVKVNDDTPVTPAAAGVTLAEAYRADAVEFWVNRRQFVAAATPAGGALWDYLYDQPVAAAQVSVTNVPGSYSVHLAVPWAALGLTARPGLAFQFAVQINDCPPLLADGTPTAAIRRTLFPPSAEWDRPSTYGTVFLAADEPAEACAPAPTAFASLTIQPCAYRRATPAVVHRLPPFADAALRLVCRDPAGAVLADTPVPAGPGDLLLDLPWPATAAGLCRAEVWLVVDGMRYGPLTEPYFAAGAVPIAEYRGTRQAPPDLRAFWTAQVAALRALPLAPQVTPIPADDPALLVEQVALTNHRGHPLLVWVSRHRGDQGRLPAELNVYPPMRAAAPVRPRPGFLGITFCGARQAACRLPGQARDEDLWARAETLADSYWLEVVLDAVRVMDYVTSRADSNGQVLVSGGSRGGWYALTLAAVAPDRVALARFTSPCYSDATLNQQLGYGSAATEIFTHFERDRVQTGGRVWTTFQYFDPLLLAELIRTPVVFSAGLQDTICSAIGMTAAANRMPKEWCTFVLDPEGGHGGSPWMGPLGRTAEQRVLAAPAGPPRP